MNLININHLNPLELTIYERLNTLASQRPSFTINDAADFCEVSSSKISKYVKKAGFRNFKQYLDFLYGVSKVSGSYTSDLHRISNFIQSFNEQLVDDLIKQLINHDKIIIFGYGPSLLCAEYFVYKLRLVIPNTVIALSDVISTERSLDNRTLLIILTTTGKFASFDNLFEQAKEKATDIAFIIEEPNPDILGKYENVFCMTNEVQSPTLQPYQKTRTMFFIFFEEVVLKLLSMHLQ